MVLEDGLEPPTRTPSTCRSTSELLQQINLPGNAPCALSYSSKINLPGKMRPARTYALACGPDPRNRTWSWRFCGPPPSHLARSGCLAPGEGLEPPSRGSEPRVLPVRPPWCLRYGALDGDRTRLQLLDRQSSPPEDSEGARERRGGGAPGRIRTSTASGDRVTTCWARLCPSRRTSTTPDLFGLPCLFGFQCADPGSREKEKGPGVARPLVDSLL
jgi:hypothetical protein